MRRYGIAGRERACDDDEGEEEASLGAYVPFAEYDARVYNLRVPEHVHAAAPRHERVGGSGGGAVVMVVVVRMVHSRVARRA